MDATSNLSQMQESAKTVEPSEKNYTDTQTEKVIIGVRTVGKTKVPYMESKTPDEEIDGARDIETETIKDAVEPGSEPFSDKNNTSTDEQPSEHVTEELETVQIKKCTKCRCSKTADKKGDDGGQTTNVGTRSQSHDKGEVDKGQEVKISSKESGEKSETQQNHDKELPDWFKMMISLTHGIHDGKELKQIEDITETFDIHGSTQATTVQTNQRLYRLILNRLHRLIRRKKSPFSCAPDFSSIVPHRKSAKDKKIHKLVENVLEPLVDIDNVDVTCEDVNAVCHKGGVPVLHIKCTSCESLYHVVAALNSPQFKEGLSRVKDCLEQETNERLDIDAAITPESIREIENHLRDQGIITGEDDFERCEVHPDKQAEMYCFEHNEICCAECATSKHGSCSELKHVTNEQNKHSVILSKVEEYNMRLQTENSPEDNCDVTASCTLPNGEIVLADMNNSRLKKLDKDFNIIDHCDLPGCPRDVCYSKNKNMVAVTLFDPAIQYVDITGGMILKERLPLDHDCFGVAFYEDILYAADPMHVYMYTLDCVEIGTVYRQLEGNHSFCKIAVSDDGEKLYIAARDGGLVTIDNEGNRLSCLGKGDLSYVTDVCVLSDGSLMVCNYRKHTVTRINSKGKYQLGRVADRTNNMYMPQSLCFDKNNSRLIIGHLHDDFISVISIT